MKPLRGILGAAASLVWIGGCVSILDVDTKNYIDAADVLCRCTKPVAQDACKGKLEAAIEEEGEVDVAELTLGCLAEAGDDCVDLYACIAADYCAGPGGPCAFDDQSRAILSCCDGGTCVDGACCGGVGTSCATQSECCGGLGCEGGTCAETCSVDGAGCDDPTECCSNQCDGGLCTARSDCRYLRAECTGDDECCSGKCTLKLCVPAVRG